MILSYKTTVLISQNIIFLRSPHVSKCSYLAKLCDKTNSEKTSVPGWWFCDVRDRVRAVIVLCDKAFVT